MKLIERWWSSAKISTKICSELASKVQTSRNRIKKVRQSYHFSDSIEIILLYFGGKLGAERLPRNTKIRRPNREREFFGNQSKDWGDNAFPTWALNYSGATADNSRASLKMWRKRERLQFVNMQHTHPWNANSCIKAPQPTHCQCGLCKVGVSSTFEYATCTFMSLKLKFKK